MNNQSGSTENEIFESVESYLDHVTNISMSYGKKPKVVPDPRIRRCIMEGSYPNWTVDENKLPTLLRYIYFVEVNSIREFCFLYI